MQVSVTEGCVDRVRFVRFYPLVDEIFDYDIGVKAISQLDAPKANIKFESDFNFFEPDKKKMKTAGDVEAGAIGGKIGASAGVIFEIKGNLALKDLF